MMRSSPLAALALLGAVGFWPTTLPAQAPAANTPATTPSSTSERLQTRVMRLQFASAAVLADVLGQFLPQLNVRPESTSNALVLTGTADQLAQAETLVKRLDTRPDASSSLSRDVQLTLLEYASPVSEGSWSMPDADALLDGTDVPKGLALRNDYRLRTLDQIPATLQLGASMTATPQNDPRVVGRVVTSQPPSAGTLVRSPRDPSPTAACWWIIRWRSTPSLSEEMHSLPPRGTP